MDTNKVQIINGWTQTESTTKIINGSDHIHLPLLLFFFGGFRE